MRCVRRRVLTRFSRARPPLGEVSVFRALSSALNAIQQAMQKLMRNLPLSLKLRLSDDNKTLNNTLAVDRGVLIRVGQTRPHPDGLILITSIELGNKRPPQAFSQEEPIIWAKRATHAKVRFAIHEGESTSSFKLEYESEAEFYVGMTLQLEGRRSKVKAINLFGGKSVKAAFASEISRVTCIYLVGNKLRQRESKFNGRRNRS